MPFTHAQRTQIFLEYKEISERTKRVSTGMSLGLNYIIPLESKDHYIAALAVYGQIIEHLIKCALEYHISKRRMLDVLHERDRFSHVDLSKLDGATLGRLISFLKQIHGHGDLIKNLKNFSKLRNEVIHHAFDGVGQTAKFEEEIRKYINDGEIKTIFSELSDLFDSITSECNRLFLTQDKDLENEVKSL